MLKFSAVLVCAAITLIGQPLATQSLSGRRAPSFALPDSRLQSHDILDSRGHWLLLDFMKTDCPHCKELSKKLEGVKGRYGAKVEILSIVVTPPETQATVAKYAAEVKSSSVFVFDQGQVAITYFRATPANPTFDTPHLFAIDPNGMIVRDWGMAGVEAPGFLSELDQLLNKK
ncbi:MAG: redoxin domain-containing protein [Bryobacteraceae bacterium]|jgi:thiol-disulfide isomerase/thioredoxin